MRRAFTLTQAARETGHARSTLWRWIQSGQVPSLKRGRFRFLSADTVTAIKTGSPLPQTRTPGGSHGA